MKIISKRLIKGQDLKEEIETLIKEENIEAGIILSSVGCVSKGAFRVADGISIKKIQENLEIISLQGTLGREGIHLHLALSDIRGQVFGGHLVDGNTINTTCELVIGVLAEYSFKRKYDEDTGYKELIVNKRVEEL